VNISLAAIVLGFALAEVAAARCPDLSGKFVLQGEDGQVHITIRQQGCERIRIVRASGYLGEVTTETHAFKIDGQPQKDSGWFGSRETLQTSAHFQGKQLKLQGQYPAGEKLVMVYSLTFKKDLSEAYEVAGESTALVAKREK
jgi:hypothetical protein